MRLKRIQNDFRVFEVLDETFFGSGPFTIYRITKRGLTTHEVVTRLAQEAGVDREKVCYAGLKDKDGITGQFMSVEKGRQVNFKDAQLTIRPIGKADRAVTSADSQGNSFEIVVRDLSGDDMRRIRHNLAQVKDFGVPAYFDDQRFGCIRHGQGFIVRHLLKGDTESAAKALVAAPSRYGSEMVEKYKEGIVRRWGKWDELASYTKGRRGQSMFAYLKDHPDDFAEAMRVGVATAERTIHLFAYQSHLWNRAAALWVKEVAKDENVGWLPCDAGPLPVFRTLTVEQKHELKNASLPLLGPGVELDERAQRLYQSVFRAEGVKMEDFLTLDLPGFRPHAEDRKLLQFAEFLRAAPAERDDIYKQCQKMRLRFTLPRGQYATMVAKRLFMTTEPNDKRICLWVSRHPLVWPDAEGNARQWDPGKKGSGERRREQEGRPAWKDREGQEGRPAWKDREGQEGRPAWKDRVGQGSRPAYQGERDDRSRSWREDRKDQPKREDRPRRDDRQTRDDRPKRDEDNPWKQRSERPRPPRRKDDDKPRSSPWG